MKVLILLLLVGCSDKFPTINYVVDIKKVEQCQTVLNEEKKTNHKICKELIYYDCHYYYLNHNSMKLFHKLKDANDYCHELRKKDAEEKK